MKKRIYILLVILLSLIGALPVSAQIIDENGQYVDTVFNDNIDRTAEDIVIASILISDPIDGVLSSAGHTAIRLQCPTFDLDYVYHYVMINTIDSISEQRAFFTGQFYVQMFADTFATYMMDNHMKGRGVTEYPISLTPQEDQQLWQLLDETLENSQQLKYDFVEHGCCERTKNIILKVLGGRKIDYTICDLRFSAPSYQLVGEAMKHVPWLRFFMLTAMSGTTNHNAIVDKLLVPQDLVSAWQMATVDGNSLLGEGKRLLPKKEFKSNVWMTPLCVAIILLLLSVISLFLNNTFLDWIIIGVQVLMAIIVVCLSVLATSFLSWNWLLIPFNPLPAICWKWRKYWALPFAGVLTIWCVAMTAKSIWGHMLVDWSHIIMVVAFIIILFKQTNFLSLMKKV